jgi:hypothetical protein
MVAIAVERLDLGRKRAGQSTQCAPGAVLLSDVLRVCEVMGTSHRHHVNRHHLRHQHGLDGIPGLDAFHHCNHEGEVDRVRLPPVHAGPHQLPQDAMHRIAIGDPQCFRHERFAKLRIWVVDSESV